MSLSRSFRRVVAVLAVALLCLVGPPAFADDSCEPFSVEATTVVVSGDGRDFELAAEGSASVGGAFTGSIVGRHNKPITVQFAVLTMDFGNGDTLTLDSKIKFDEVTGLSFGTYEITGGTGEFEGASGSGDLIADTGGGTFLLDGTICR